MKTGSKHCLTSQRRPGMHKQWAAFNLDRQTRVQLDSLGLHRERNWRQMPGETDISKAITFWLWRRGLMAHLKDELAAADAVRDLPAEEAAANA
jgi:hypothetical protein